MAKATVASVAAASGIPEAKVAKAIAEYIPTEFSEGFFADGVALVEGQTDRVVIQAAAIKLGLGLDRRGITALSVEGKGGLCVARAILTALGIATHVIADGDFGASDRKLNKSEAEKFRAHESNRADTERLVAKLPKPIATGAVPYRFGDPTVVCADYTIWRDDIEQELTAWTSFVQQLKLVDIELSARKEKNLLAYRNAVEAADVNEMPAVIKAAIEAIAGMARGWDAAGDASAAAAG